MKKIIFMSLCVLFVAGTTVFAASYSVSGKVYYKDSGLPVNLPNVTITMGASSGGCTSDQFGNYSGGWTDCGAGGCVGNQMTLRATKGNYAGSVTWTAQSGSETKDIYISSTVVIDPDLGVGTEPIHFASPGTQTANLAYAYSDSGTIEVASFSSQLAFDESKMMCAIVLPSPAFMDAFGFLLGPGIVTVTADATGGVPVTLGGIDNPTELFMVVWDVQDFDTASRASVVFNDANSEFMTPEPNSPVLNRTDYLIGEPSYEPFLLIETEEDWLNALLEGQVRPMDPCDWTNYMYDWEQNLEDGNSYPECDFNIPELYVYEGNDTNPNEPNDAGLVMYWGSNSLPDGNYASAWKFKYDADPDLRNCTIQITVTAPQFGLAGNVTSVSFGINDAAGLRRHWWWSVGNPPNPIQWNTPTTVIINTAQTGVVATTPTATGYMNMPGFNLAQSISFDVDENFQWIFGQLTVPPPGQPTFAGMWNYWHNLIVTPNIGPGGANSKWYIKYSQPPVVIDNNNPPIINGWDERSDYNDLIMADDWLCEDERFVTDFHWWGSFIGWTQPHMPPIVPKAFHIGIWTDDPNDGPGDFSHPNDLIWENYCDNWVWNFAGLDKDPFDRPERENEACFQFTQLLSENEWFRQEPNEPNGTVYWLSIAPIYDPNDYQDPNFYHWGWKSRPHKFQDDAVSITALADGSWPPTKGAVWSQGNPLKGPQNETWDLAFELTTNVPGPPSADINNDGIVNLLDLAIMANQWLTAGP